MKYSAGDVSNAREMLTKYAPPGSTIFCVLRSRSRSGMSRRIDFYTIDEGKRLQYLTGWMHVLFDKQRSDKGMRVDGSGMDMGFHVVDQLASALYARDARGLGNGLRCEWI